MKTSIIPFEVRPTKEGGCFGVRVTPDGKEVLQTDWIMTKVIQPGKAMRVSEKEWHEAAKKYTNGKYKGPQITAENIDNYIR